MEKKIRNYSQDVDTSLPTYVYWVTFLIFLGVLAAVGFYM